MLLLLLSFYVHYGLLNCEEHVKAKVNESLLVDYHRQKLLQVDALLEDLEQKTRKLSVLLAVDSNDTKRETYVLRGVTSREDQNNQNPKNSTKPAHLLASAPYHAASIPFAGAIPVISPDPGVTPGPRIPRIFYKPRTYAGLDVTHSSLSENDPDFFTSCFLSLISTYTPLSTTPSPVTTPSSAIKTTPLGRIVRDWLNEIAPYTRVRKKKRNSSSGQSQPTVPISPTMIKPTSLTGSGKTWQQFNEYKHGSRYETLALKVSRLGKTPGDPYKSWTTEMTTAGDVLFGKIKVQKPSTTVLIEPPRYKDLMSQLGEGYLVVFGIEMFRLIAVKDKREVQEVLAPVETIYKTSLETGGLLGVDNPFLTIFGNLARMTSEDDIDSLRTYSSMMFHTLLQRKEVLSPEVNSIIDQAEVFYSDEEGKRLLRSLTQFEDYPNTNTSSFSICESLIESILQPFRRPADSKSRQKLETFIEKALRQNFFQHLKDSSVGTPTTLSLIGTTISTMGTQPRKRKKKLHHHKKKRKRKIRPKLEYYTTNTRPDTKELNYKQLSFTKPISTTRSAQTKRINKRKLVHHRVKQRYQAPHVQASRIATRTPRYQRHQDLKT